MSTLRSASYALGILVLSGLCAVFATGGPKSAALAKAVPLLFVSDSKANVMTIFSLPGLAVTGTITGLNEPRGLCTDPSGDIWATNYGSQIIGEYTRAGTLIETLTDAEGYPFSCTVDELVVGNIQNFASPSPSPSPSASPMSGPGETVVYVSGVGTSYDLPALFHVDGVTDPGKDIYIVGRAKDGTFTLAVLPAGSTTIQQIPVTGGTINHPGMVQYDAEDGYLAVGDRVCGGTPRTTCVYHIQISPGFASGKIVGATKLQTYNGQPICDMAQGVIRGSGKAKYLAGGDDETQKDCGSRANSSVDVWAFPAGGAPTNYNNTALSNPFGTAISDK